MKIELSEEGARYLLRKVAMDVEYYGLLVGHPKCSVGNRAKWELVRELEERLSEVIEAKEVAR